MMKRRVEPIARSAQGVLPMIGQNAFGVLLKPQRCQLGAQELQNTEDLLAARAPRLVTDDGFHGKVVEIRARCGRVGLNERFHGSTFVLIIRSDLQDLCQLRHQRPVDDQHFEDIGRLPHGDQVGIDRGEQRVGQQRPQLRRIAPGAFCLHRVKDHRGEIAEDRIGLVLQRLFKGPVEGLRQRHADLDAEPSGVSGQAQRDRGEKGMIGAGQFGWLGGFDRCRVRFRIDRDRLSHGHDTGHQHAKRQNQRGQEERQGRSGGAYHPHDVPTARTTPIGLTVRRTVPLPDMTSVFPIRDRHRI